MPIRNDQEGQNAMPIDISWITEMFSTASAVCASDCNEIHFSSAEDFLSCLAVFSIRQKPFWDQETSNLGWLFRGHWDATWTMLPSAHRCVQPFAEFGYDMPDQNTVSKEEYWQRMVEREAFLLEHFQTLANTFSLPCDFSPSIFDELAQMRADHQQSFYDDWKFFPKSKWYPILAKAQHHGIPTRLLDFSDNGLLSAYFAASKIWDDQSSGLETEGRLCVWAFHQNDLRDLHCEPDVNTNSKNWLKVPAISQLGSNFASQRGSLVLHEGANNFFENNGRWPDFFKDGGAGSFGDRKKKFFKLTLDQSKAKDALRILNMMQICPVAVYPSLDNVSATLNFRHWLKN